MKLKYYILVLVFTLSLTGCRYVQSNVAVFHDLSQSNLQIKYSFMPLKGQKGNLEYISYRKLISQKFAAHGFLETDENPDYFIAFAYGIDGGKEEIDSVPFFGQTGVSSATTYGNVNSYGNSATYSGTTTYQPTYGVVGSAAVSNTVFTRKLELSIINIKNSKPEEPAIVYQANIVSSGSSPQVATVMPYMIEALFKKFPGESGKTRKETIQMK